MTLNPKPKTLRLVCGHCTRQCAHVSQDLSLFSTFLTVVDGAALPPHFCCAHVPVVPHLESGHPSGPSAATTAHKHTGVHNVLSNSMHGRCSELHMWHHRFLCTKPDNMFPKAQHTSFCRIGSGHGPRPCTRFQPAAAAPASCERSLFGPSCAFSRVFQSGSCSESPPPLPSTW